MFIETRKQGKKTKYYLIHSYRIENKIKRISRYLGSNLNKKDIQRLKKRAKELILEQVKDKHPFDLSEAEIKELKKYEKQIEIKHLDWKRFTRDFTYNTNAIEGSKVDYEGTKNLIEKKDEPENYDEIEAVNVAKAINFVKKTNEKLSIDLIKRLHFICFKGTKIFAGKLRNIEVVIKNSLGIIVHRGAPFKEVESLMKELIQWYNENEKKYPPLLLASIVHNQFEKIHPFQDGNGRIGRLLLNYVLLKHNYPPINIKVEDRREYYEILRRFDKERDIESTLKFLISQYRKK